jgi:hypothetical protein
MDREQFSNSKPVSAFAAAALSLGANNGVSIDTQNYRSLTIPVSLTITTGEVSGISFEDSPDNSVWTPVPAVENIFYPGSFPLTGAGAKLVHVGTVAKERYVRMVITCTGTVSIAADIMAGLLQDSQYKPQVKESSDVADADIIAPGKLADADTTAPKRPLT